MQLENQNGFLSSLLRISSSLESKNVSQAGIIRLIKQQFISRTRSALRGTPVQKHLSTMKRRTG
jgi:hypothetical protein